MSDLTLKETIQCCKYITEGIDDIDESLVCDNAAKHLQTQEQRIEELKEREQDLINALEDGVNNICNAVGVEAEMYDRDQADICCYIDCFKDAADMLKAGGFWYDPEDLGFNNTPKL